MRVTVLANGSLDERISVVFDDALILSTNGDENLRRRAGKTEHDFAQTFRPHGIEVTTRAREHEILRTFF